MGAPVAEVKRNYDASGRRERARQRRRDVVAAAQELFEADGFQATTISAVAARAGVSAESVYKGFGSKAALAKAVFDFVLAGDDEPVPIVQRPELLAVQQEPDVRRKLRLYVDGLIRDGRHADETLRETWQTLLDERSIGMRNFGRHLLETGQLRPDITLDEVTDVLWTYIAVELYELLVLQRGWSPERYGGLLASALITALCEPNA
jgi:AcrR family transcriptional regulator